LAAARYFDPPLEVLNIPFVGAAGEGTFVRAYLRKPAGVERPPVVIHHGGIDSFKEERHRYAGPVLGRGWASLAIDMPGTSESPVKGALDGERVYEPVLAHLRERSDVDGNRVALVGGSFGGYWATKAAHVYHDQLAGVVNWGGGVHYGFQPDWINASRYAGSYLTDLLGTRAFAFGLGGADDWLEFAPKLSMLDSGGHRRRARADAAGERQGRCADAHRGSVSAAGARCAQRCAGVPGRPHGPDAGHLPNDPALDRAPLR
jgi:pimeloyl-ACP methyl ester carboxylesterase